MDLYIGVSIVLIAIMSGFICLMAMACGCLEALLENMPLNEWVPFDEMVKLGKSKWWITYVCLQWLVKGKCIEARPSAKAVAAAEERMMKRVIEILERLKPEERKDVLIGFKNYYKDLRELEFMLLVRPRKHRRIEKEVTMPDFTPHSS